MSGAWVAGAVRGRLMLERGLGAEGARALARAGSLEEAASLLAGTIYASAGGGAVLEEAERELAAAVALRVRTLAAWLPPEGASVLRALGGWFEIANVEDRLAYLVGGRLWPAIPLGVLSSIWGAAAEIEDPAELRRLLAASSWGAPAGDRPEEILLALRFGWAHRVVRQVPEAAGWASGAAAVVLATELFLSGRPVDPSVVPAAVLGPGWSGASAVPDLRARLPAAAAWTLARIDDPAELWRAELLWWQQVAAEARTMSVSGLLGRRTIVGVAALLALDAIRVATALAVVSSGGSQAAWEVLNGLCVA